MIVRDFSRRTQRMVKTLCSFYVFFAFAAGNSSAQGHISSPDGKIKVSVSAAGGKAFYNIHYNGKLVLANSRLGLVRTDDDFSETLRFERAGDNAAQTRTYNLVHGKKSTITYTYNQKVFYFTNSHALQLAVIFDVANDGVVFRYFFPDDRGSIKTIAAESTSFHFLTDTRAWLQPMSKARSGWEHSNPSYEEHYLQETTVNTPPSFDAGWIYPALFKTGDTWMLITESDLRQSYCGTRLLPAGEDELKIGFPDSLEAFTHDQHLPNGQLPFHSPCRVIAIGNLSTIIESTLGTDFSEDYSNRLFPEWIRPGKASWSWIMSKDEHITYDEQKKYIDFAADMKWQYCLIDVNWDTKIGYEKIAELTNYAKDKNVGLILWYNSSGDWNTTKYHPKSALLTKEQREKEFSRIQQMGIKGIKVDFFGGDGQSMIKYYIGILEDAAKYKLLVNFHGATLPRGWHRTYPHLLTTEAVRGFEMVTFGQGDADKQATHCTILPFTRNAFDPMDFTPMNLYKVTTNSIRRTTSAFELALSVLFLSGIQHFAESPEGMAKVPVYVKKFLQQLPDNWDDVRFIDGYPGKEVIIARRSGNKWYVAGINGELKEKKWTLDLSFLKGKKAQLISDGAEDLSFTTSEKTIPGDGKMMITVKPNGGFVIVVE
jgi:alpha-glucosidase